MTTRRRTKRTRIGSNGLLGLVLCAVALCAQKRADTAYALLAGTVFDQRGFSVAGASVVLTADGPSKLKKQEATTDARGEFAFRVPPGKTTWRLRVSRKGFENIEKTGEIDGEGRKDVTIELSAESK
jgi:Carboxypeptidase regulatory-like domain